MSSISVVIPARNAEAYLGEALDSILAQTHAPAEVIVVDDGSEDRTAEIAGSYGEPVRVIAMNERNTGVVRNAGVHASFGEFVAFLDADDLWEPRWLELALEALERASLRLSVAVGMVREFLSPEISAEEGGRLRVLTELRRATLAAGILVPRATLDRVGGFDAEHVGAEFSDWLLRARDLGVAELHVDEHTLNRRVHLANSTLVNPEVVRDHLFALKASLDRRRAQGAL